jgi:hypothetical protein
MNADEEHPKKKKMMMEDHEFDEEDLKDSHEYNKSIDDPASGGGDSDAESSKNINIKKRTWRKPKDKPKRPLSSYNIFFRKCLCFQHYIFKYCKLFFSLNCTPHTQSTIIVSLCVLVLSLYQNTNEKGSYRGGRGMHIQKKLYKVWKRY